MKRLLQSLIVRWIYSPFPAPPARLAQWALGARIRERLRQ